MISHEAPSLLSRLCTVLIADLSMRAAYNASAAQSSHHSGTQRTIVSSKDLKDVTIGSGVGSGSEWEFLREIFEVSGMDTGSA